ncbi:MAG: exopolysaccharide biosynthesis polyprenyl glycosylphosphotransferase [Lachnospiraceae bacterium]|nr:exopolysaccharide biosynthesis polyprenyl glycosylphosphotransferase [Lachnospiraceae bacterium]
MLEFVNIGLFAYIWIIYYNSKAFTVLAVQGATVVILAYVIMYNMLCHTYRAFKIASNSLGNALFGQLVSFGIADLVSWVSCCLMHRWYVDIIPGLRIVFVQLFCTGFLIFIMKRVLRKHLIPKATIIIRGRDIPCAETDLFKKKLMKKYAHLYRVYRIMSEDSLPTTDRNEVELLAGYLDEAETIILYEVSHEWRRVLFQASIRDKKELLVTPTISDVFLEGFNHKPYIDTPILKFEYNSEKSAYRVVKRILDVIFSVIALVILSPLFLVVAICIKAEDGGPVFYKQERYTMNARKFRIIKFRSMVVDAEKNGFIPSTEGDPRITKVGKVIRATRIDELPQIINILKGDMSWVGPRPERTEHVEEYTKNIPEFNYRLLVRGGLTGYAQVFGKYNTTAYDKLRLDLIYIENFSVLMDLRILVLTLKIIFTPEATEGFTQEDSDRISGKDEG